MKAFVKRMIEEHAELVVRIVKLDNYVYSNKSDNDDKIEFANKCVQLSSMKKYEEALRARLENQNIVVDGGDYLEKVGSIKFEEADDVPPTTEGDKGAEKGSDFDADKNE